MVGLSDGVHEPPLALVDESDALLAEHAARMRITSTTSAAS